MKKVGKNGTKYLDSTYYVGFYNTKKKNPNEPDLRVHIKEPDGVAGKEVASLWCNTSKAGNKYLTGHLNNAEKTKLVGFLSGKNKPEKAPDIRIYKQEEYDKFNSKESYVQGGGLDNPDTPNKMYSQPDPKTDQVNVEDDDLPF